MADEDVPDAWELYILDRMAEDRLAYYQDPVRFLYGQEIEFRAMLWSED